MSDCLSRLALAQLTTRELGATDQARAEQHLRGCASCAGRLEELTHHAADYEQRADDHRRQLRLALAVQKQRQTLWPLLAVPALALLALVVMVTGPGDPDRYKGAFTLRYVAKRGSEQFVVKDNDRLLAGDALRAAVTTDRTGYLWIVLVDADGTVTSLYPEAPPSADPTPMTLERSGTTTLPGSIILDDAPGTERLVCFFSEQPFRRDQLLKQLEAALARGELPAFKGQLRVLPITKVLSPSQP
jgi:hypothetical protein